MSRIQAYRTQINYTYWITRCSVEADDTTASARRYMRTASQKASELAPEEARELFEQAWTEWDKIFTAHPSLEDGLMYDELTDSFKVYKRVLDQLDEEFEPSEFKLQRLVDEYGREDSPLPKSNEN